MKRSNVSHVAFCVLLSACINNFISPPHARADDSSEKDAKQMKTVAILDRVEPRLQSALALYEKHASLPGETAFYDFWSKTKSDNSKEIVATLDKAAKGLELDEVSRCLGRIRAAAAAIDQNIANKSGYIRARESAPASSLNPLTTTKAGYDKKMEDAEKAIDGQRHEIVQAKADLLEALKAIDIVVDQELLDQIVDSATRDDVISMCVVFESVKSVTSKLRELTEKSGEDLATAKKYYGMHLMLVWTLARTQDTFIARLEKIDVELELCGKQSQANIREAQTQLRSGGDAKAWQNNIAANQSNYTVAEEARKNLRALKAQVEAARRNVTKVLELAENTYKTVKNSAEVASLANISRPSFDAVMKLQLPELRQFQNVKINEELRRMTAQRASK